MDMSSAGLDIDIDSDTFSLPSGEDFLNVPYSALVGAQVGTLGDPRGDPEEEEEDDEEGEEEEDDEQPIFTKK